jgi:chemotaxis protein methyltransferase CheR
MTESIPDTMLLHLSEFVADRIGLYFPKKRWDDLERKICSAATEFGFKDAQSCAGWLLSSPHTKSQIEILASHLTVGETYFFRQKKSFEVLKEHILPQLIRSRRGSGQHLRIWSVGCSTGEEAYSLAILFSKLIPDRKDWNIRILATDINPRFLKKASEGVYSEWSFRDTPQWVKERYFKKRDDSLFEIISPIKEMVTFSYHNLAEDTYPSILNSTNAMDIIFCRNVLMYFAPERAKQVIDKLYHSLVDDGWLIVSPSETSHFLFSQFTSVNFPDAILYRKAGRLPQTLEILQAGPDEEANISLQTPPGFITEINPEVTFSVENRETLPKRPGPSLPPAIDEQKTAEPQTSDTQGRYIEAADRILKLIADDQKDPKAATFLARAYANQGRLDEALEWCEKAITADKLNSGLHYLRAAILQEQGSIDDAVVPLKRALYLDQDFVLAHFALGDLAMRRGRRRESNRHFRNALMLLRGYDHEDILPESEGITAGRLSEIITSITGEEESV